MKKFLLIMLFSMFFSTAYAVTYQTFAAGGAAATCKTSDSIASCATAINDYGRNIFLEFKWNDENNVPFSFQLQPNGDIVFRQGSTILGFYSGQVQYGYGFHQGSERSSKIRVKSGTVIISLKNAKYPSLETQYTTCVSFPEQAQYPKYRCFDELYSSSGGTVTTNVFYTYNP